jgi:hypothetical protein
VPAQVDPDDQVPLLGRHREDHPVAQHARVVDQDVQLPVLPQRGGQHLLAHRPLADVPGRHRRLPARGPDLGRHRLDGVPGQVVDHQPGPGRGQGQRLHPAEPLARPSDYGYLAIQHQ